MKNFGKSSHGVVVVRESSQGVPKFFRAPIYMYGAYCGHLFDSTAFLLEYS